jgi:hypothetical protein
MTYYTIKLDDAVQLTGNIVPAMPPGVKKPIKSLPGPQLYNEEYSCFEISGDLIVDGNIMGTGSLASIISSKSAPPMVGEPDVKGKIVYSNDFLYLCVDDVGTWVRWAVGIV